MRPAGICLNIAQNTAVSYLDRGGRLWYILGICLTVQKEEPGKRQTGAHRTARKYRKPECESLKQKPENAGSGTALRAARDGQFSGIWGGTADGCVRRPSRKDRRRQEAYTVFDSKLFLEKLDGLYASHRLSEAGAHLMEGLCRASETGDREAVLLILNEMIGFYRVSGRYEECENCSRQAILLAERMGLKGTVSFATTLLNAATASREAGDRALALSRYQEAAAIYEKELLPNDYRRAAVLNNIAILFSEEGRAEQAESYFRQALSIIVQLEGTRAEQATTKSNLALALLRLGRREEADRELAEALALFETQEGGQSDPHYGAALAALGEACARAGKFKESAAAYERALAELRDCYGENDYYRTVEANLKAVKILAENAR